MIAALAPLYTGPLEWLRGRAILAGDAPAQTGAARDGFTPAGLDRMIRLHAPNYAPGDERAVLSIWSKYYLAAAIYTPVAAQLILGRALPTALDQIGLVLADTGEVEKLVLPHAGESAPPADASARFLALIDNNLGPAIDAMAAHNGLSPRVYWSNAGHYFHHLTSTLTAMPNPPTAVHETTRMMTLRRLADGRRNPLFRPIQPMTDSHGAHHMMRRVCCVRFQLDGLGYCGNCPLELERPVKGTRPNV